LLVEFLHLELEPKTERHSSQVHIDFVLAVDDEPLQQLTVAIGVISIDVCGFVDFGNATLDFVDLALMFRNLVLA
jgi:hypothetical protein